MSSATCFGKSNSCATYFTESAATRSRSTTTVGNRSHLTPSYLPNDRSPAYLAKSPTLSSPSTFPVFSPPEGDAAFIDQDEDHVLVDVNEGKRLDVHPDDAKLLFADDFAGCNLTTVLITYAHKPEKTILLSHFPPTRLKENFEFFKQEFAKDHDLKNGIFYELKIHTWGDRKNSVNTRGMEKKISQEMELYCTQLYHLGIHTHDKINEIISLYHEPSHARGYFIRSIYGELSADFLGEDIFLKSSYELAQLQALNAMHSASHTNIVSNHFLSASPIPQRNENTARREELAKNLFAKNLYEGFLKRMFSKEGFRKALLSEANAQITKASRLKISLMEFTSPEEDISNGQQAQEISRYLILAEQMGIALKKSKASRFIDFVCREDERQRFHAEIRKNPQVLSIKASPSLHAAIPVAAPSAASPSPIISNKRQFSPEMPPPARPQKKARITDQRQDFSSGSGLGISLPLVVPQQNVCWWLNPLNNRWVPNTFESRYSGRVKIVNNFYIVGDQVAIPLHRIRPEYRALQQITVGIHENGLLASISQNTTNLVL